MTVTHHLTWRTTVRPGSRKVCWNSDS
jgi:hypothetical protein